MAPPKPKKSNYSKYYDEKLGKEPFVTQTDIFIDHLENNILDIISDYGTKIKQVFFNTPEWCVKSYLNKNKDKDGYVRKIHKPETKKVKYGINAKL